MDRNFAYIRVNGKRDFSEVTNALKLAPTKSWNVGDKRRNGSIYDFSHWSYESERFEQDYLDQAIEEVLSFIQENEIDFSKIPEGFEASIQCVGYHEKKSPGFHLSKDTILRLGKLALAVDFDLYCDAE